MACPFGYPAPSCRPGGAKVLKTKGNAHRNALERAVSPLGFSPNFARPPPAMYEILRNLTKLGRLTGHFTL
jgi:hypothetical protein